MISYGPILLYFILQPAVCVKHLGSIDHIQWARGPQYKYSECYTMVPACQICPEEFMSNFTNETEYYRLQAVLSSQSSFTTLTHPAGHSMNTLNAIRWCQHAKFVPKNLCPILQMRPNITACRLF